MNALIGFVNSFFSSLYTVAGWLLDGFLLTIKGGLFFIFDGLLTVIQAAVGAINFGSLATSTVGLWAGLPPQMIWVINATGIPSGLSMIATAIALRLMLNIIPAEFTRL